MKLIKDLGMKHPKPTSRRVRRYGLYECPICFKHFEAQTQSVKSGLSTKCRSCATTIKNTTHGSVNHPLFSKWSNMIQRCENPNSKNYKYYGGRGITVCDEWKDNPNAYYDYITSLPNAMKKGYSIDRINNDKGYEPNNVRWASASGQGVNRRVQNNNTSGYKGIIWHKQSNRWIARIGVDNKSIHMGSYTSIEDALNARNKYILDNGLDENYLQQWDQKGINYINKVLELEEV